MNAWLSQAIYSCSNFFNTLTSNFESRLVLKSLKDFKKNYTNGAKVNGLCFFLHFITRYVGFIVLINEFNLNHVTLCELCNEWHDTSNFIIDIF